MKIDLITTIHPKIKNREITFLYVDNKLDLPSARFLIHEARYGGIGGERAGETSHKGRAIKIRELYRSLDDMKLTWRNAIETDIEMIRNSMLCWDANSNADYDFYNYTPISNDAMNQKIGTWFKFYNYAKDNNEVHDMIMSTKLVKRKNHKTMLQHIGEREKKNHNLVEVWSLRVKPSPYKPTYHAISKSEFEILRRELEQIDPVYGMIAYLMVETGLRIRAALQIKTDEFKHYFRYLNVGKKADDCISIPYISKGGHTKYCDLPIRTIAVIQKEYLSRIHLKRLTRYSDRTSNSKYDENAIWLLENGKKVNYTDVRKAFAQASEKMGRTTNRITSHWMRHTFATWTLIEFQNKEGIYLKNTGVTPNPLFMVLLAQKLGHTSEQTTMKYIATALKLMKIDSHLGPIMSFRTFSVDRRAQEIVELEAKEEFGDTFNSKIFDVFKYAESRRIMVKDE